MPRSTALHMSYTVSAATDAATSASISTPVRPRNRASVTMRSPGSEASGSTSTVTAVRLS